MHVSKNYVLWPPMYDLPLYLKVHFMLTHIAYTILMYDGQTGEKKLLLIGTLGVFV